MAKNTQLNRQGKKPLLKKIWNKIKSPIDLAIVGIIQILTFIVSPNSLNLTVVGLSLSYFIWAKEQQKKVLIDIEKEINRLGIKIEDIKIDHDKFMEDLSELIKISSKSACEEKRKYLVNAFINSIVTTHTTFTGKQTFWRILAQISVEEIQALKVIKDQNEFIVDIKSISKSLNWNEQDTIVICEALSQLMLIKNASIGQYDSFNNDQIWSITSLGSKFIQWCHQKQTFSID
jgi:hypothetical protein